MAIVVIHSIRVHVKAMNCGITRGFLWPQLLNSYGKWRGEVHFPYEFIGFGAMDGQSPDEFIGVEPWMASFPMNS